jgi:hypothetical protein
MDDPVAHYHRRKDVGGISGMEAFHVVCKEVQAAVSAEKVVATVFCDMQGSFRRCHAAWWGGISRRLKIRFDVGDLACFREV